MKGLNKILDGKEESHILPFLWLKGETNDLIENELDKIQACGIREVCLESRPHPDFCGTGWWKNLDFIMETLQKRNMKAWILDDDKFPTGHANGGFVTKPEHKKIYLAQRHMDLYGPCRSGAALVGNFMNPDGKLLAIMAVPKPDGNSLAVSGEGAIDLTERYHNGFVYFDLPKGPYRLFVFFTTRQGGGRDDYMNLIDSQSVKVLIDEVYETHYKRYSPYFGTTIAGFFSDEPELGNVKGYGFDVELGKGEQRLPWSSQLETALRNEWGDQFTQVLPALWYEAGEKTKKIRYKYMDKLTHLVRDCFSSQIGKWCQDRGVEYIGHIIEDDNAHARMGCSVGHYFREMEGQHMAGIDVVHHQIVPGFTEPVHQWIAGDRDGEFFHFGLGKLGSSAAHIQKNKKNRALCEIFGNYGWAEGISLMKWLTNHMLVRGINQFTPHAFSMSDTDKDCPPHFYAKGTNPGFPCFKELMKYMNSGAEFLSNGIHLADAAILYHAEAEWYESECMYFQKPGRKLMEAQLDYDVVPMDALREDKEFIIEDCLRLNEEKYLCLILPQFSCMDEKLIPFFQEAAQKGFPVFAVNKLPQIGLHGTMLPKGWGRDIEIVSLTELSERVRTLRIQHRSKLPQLKNELGDMITFPHLRSYFVQEQEGIAGMYFNESVDETLEGVLHFGLGNEIQVDSLDPWNRKVSTYHITQQGMPFILMPGESKFIYVNESQEERVETKQQPPKLCWKKELACPWIISRNNLDQGIVEKPLQITTKELPNLNGPDYYQDYVGTYSYEGEFSSAKETNKSYFILIPEAHDWVKLYLNEKEVAYQAGFPARIEITNQMQDGSNKIVIEVSTTLVWKKKDGASTHLQIPASGITARPILECFE